MINLSGQLEFISWMFISSKWLLLQILLLLMLLTLLLLLLALVLLTMVFRGTDDVEAAVLIDDCNFWSSCC